MFGMGFMEIFLVLIVAIMALGPEKLPGAIVDIVKVFKKIKGEINDAKVSIDNELDISSLKKDAEELKASVSNMKSMASVDLDDLTSITDDEPKKIEKKEKVKKVMAKKVKEKNPTKQNISMYSNNEDA